MSFTIGSISSGTLRPVDLLPAFVSALLDAGGTLPPDLECVKHLEYHNYPANDFDAIEDEFWESEDAGWDLAALGDALGEVCPPLVYFGTLPGDGADFGFWPDHDAIEEAQRYGEAWDEDSEFTWLEEWSVWLHVSDHGNVAVLADTKGAPGTELWSAV